MQQQEREAGYAEPLESCPVPSSQAQDADDPQNWKDHVSRIQGASQDGECDPIQEVDDRYSKQETSPTRRRQTVGNR